MERSKAEQLLLTQIERALSARSGGRVTVGVDGRCGTGKSTLAAALAARFHAPIVRMDDFFLPDGLRTPARLAEPGGNVHYERFLAEVAPFLRTGDAFSYGVFDCGARRVTHRASIPAGALVIVEGAYAFHPRFGAPYDVRAFVTADPAAQRLRLRERSGEAMLTRFLNEWIPMEERYFWANGLPSDGDVVIDTTAINCSI